VTVRRCHRTVKVSPVAHICGSQLPTKRSRGSRSSCSPTNARAVTASSFAVRAPHMPLLDPPQARLQRPPRWTVLRPGAPPSSRSR